MNKKYISYMKWVIGLILIVILLALGLNWFISTMDEREFAHVTYNESCANCHGDSLQGTANGPSLMTPQLKYGDNTLSLTNSIQRLNSHTDSALHEILDQTSSKALAIYIGERRERYPNIPDSYFHQYSDSQVTSKYHNFRVERFADLVSRPYSIAPLPDGRIIVNEKVRGMTIVDEHGKQGNLIEGAPKTYKQLLSIRGTYLGWGQLLDVALHKNYSSNGWIYVAFTDRCQLDCSSVAPQSMVRVVRGKIQNGKWLDQENIWSVHKDFYTIVPDNVAGGRLAFDNENNLYISVGGKAFYKHLHDMNTPYGKVHRVKDDGTVPKDNPFWQPNNERDEVSTRHTVWSYGHRTIQGLEGNPLNGEIWGSEMGQRGGDEINKIVKEGNYGWPLYTNGLDYDSTENSIGKDLGLNFPIEETVLPAVDFTPAPAISNLTFYHGKPFHSWSNDILVGSLKALTLYRLRISDGQLIEKEKLVTNLGRIRDIEIGIDGLVYIAIEHGDTGSIVRLMPES